MINYIYYQGKYVCSCTHVLGTLHMIWLSVQAKSVRYPSPIGKLDYHFVKAVIRLQGVTPAGMYSVCMITPQDVK